MTLYEHVMSLWMYESMKHGLGSSAEEYAHEKFNSLTPAEQLKLISNALDEMK